MLLAFPGVAGLRGIGFFSYDPLRPVLEKSFREQGLSGVGGAGGAAFRAGDEGPAAAGVRLLAGGFSPTPAAAPLLH